MTLCDASRVAEAGGPDLMSAADPAASTAHRNDIDGLRAIAVLPVVAYHVGIAPFASGFVGVNVFFVISGYLIGSIIVRESMAHRFSFVRFYERRIRRIIPALFVVLAATTAVAVLLLPPIALV